MTNPFKIIILSIIMPALIGACGIGLTYEKEASVILELKTSPELNGRVLKFIYDYAKYNNFDYDSYEVTQLYGNYVVHLENKKMIIGGGIVESGKIIRLGYHISLIPFNKPEKEECMKLITDMKNMEQSIDGVEFLSVKGLDACG